MRDAIVHSARSRLSGRRWAAAILRGYAAPLTTAVLCTMLRLRGVKCLFLPPSSCPHAVRPGKFRSIIQILQSAAIGQVTRRLAPWELTVGLGGSRSWRALRTWKSPLLRVGNDRLGARRDWTALAKRRLHKSTAPGRVPRSQSSRLASSVPLTHTRYSVVQYKALCSARPFSCPLGRCVVMISIPLSLLQYYSTLVSVNGDDLDIVDSWIRGEISGPESPQVNWLVWRKTWERRHSQTARRCQILANSGSARGILTEHDRTPVSVLPYLVPLCT